MWNFVQRIASFSDCSAFNSHCRANSRYANSVSSSDRLAGSLSPSPSPDRPISISASNPTLSPRRAQKPDNHPNALGKPTRQRPTACPQFITARRSPTSLLLLVTKDSLDGSGTIAPSPRRRNEAVTTLP